jgi:hypothetical protein
MLVVPAVLPVPAVLLQPASSTIVSMPRQTPAGIAVFVHDFNVCEILMRTSLLPT